MNAPAALDLCGQGLCTEDAAASFDKGGRRVFLCLSHCNEVARACGLNLAQLAADLPGFAWVGKYAAHPPVLLSWTESGGPSPIEPWGIYDTVRDRWLPYTLSREDAHERARQFNGIDPKHASRAALPGHRFRARPMPRGGQS